jgi:glycine cleavage system H protein
MANYEVRPIPRYIKEHMWARDMGDGTVKIGITDYAQTKLGEIIFVSLPDVGSKVKQGECFATAESNKSVSEVFSPVSGVVKAINEVLQDDPGIANKDPYDSGWFVLVEASNFEEESKKLLDSDSYAALLVD